MTSSLTPARELRRLVALADAHALQEFLSSHPGWHELVDGSFSAWSRVLADKNPRRSALLEVFLKNGLDPNRSVFFRGKTRYPLSIALQYGRYATVDRLLKAGASARFQWKNRSPLEMMVANFDRLPVNIHGEPTLSTNVAALDSWLVRLRQSGAPLTPTFLEYACRHTTEPGEAMFILLEEGLAEGKMPAVPGTVVGFYLGKAAGILHWALCSEDNAPLSYLTQALKGVPPSAAWAIELFEVTRLKKTIPADRVLQVINCFEEAWSKDGWDHPDRWPNNVINGWLHGLTTSTVNQKKNLAFFVAMQWGIDNGMPSHMLLADPRSLGPRFLEKGGVELRIPMLTILAKKGFTLSSVLAPTKKNPNQTLQEFLEGVMRKSWSKHAEEIVQLFAKHRAEKLAENLPMVEATSASRVRL